MADYDKLLQVPRGTKARLEQIKLDLLVNTIVYATDMKELGIKLSNGNIEYFMNATDIDARIDTIETSKQDKLVAGDNIIIDENNVISASDEIDLNMLGYMNYAADIYYKGRKQSLFANAWESSLAVDPSEISEESDYSSPRGITQYPNGEIYGVIIPQGVTTIGKSAFYNWSLNNQPLVIPNSVTSIGTQAFQDWRVNNQPLVIPDSVTSIGDYAFHGWNSAKEFIMESETPPTITNSSFSNTNDAPIYVPDNSVDDYKTATNWVDLADRIFPISDKGNTYTKGEIDLMIGDIDTILDSVLGV